MTYQRFEDLPVWNEAIRLGERVYETTVGGNFEGYYSLKDQLERAAVSVSSNIAEGFERGTTPELINFIYIAKGSAGEVRSILHLAGRIPRLREMRSEMGELKAIAESCSRQLKAWAESLQNSPIKGTKYVNERVRREVAQEKRARETQKRLLEMLPETHPLRVAEKNKNEPGF